MQCYQPYWFVMSRLSYRQGLNRTSIITRSSFPAQNTLCISHVTNPGAPISPKSVLFRPQSTYYLHTWSLRRTPRRMQRKRQTQPGLRALALAPAGGLPIFCKSEPPSPNPSGFQAINCSITDDKVHYIGVYTNETLRRCGGIYDKAEGTTTPLQTVVCEGEPCIVQHHSSQL